MHFRLETQDALQSVKNHFASLHIARLLVLKFDRV